MSDPSQPPPKPGTFQWRLIYSSVPEEDRIPPIANENLNRLVHIRGNYATRRVRFAVSRAQIAVLRLHHGAMGTEHLLLGLLRDYDRDLEAFLLALGQDRRQLYGDWTKELVAGVADKPQAILLTPACERVVHVAQEEAGEQQVNALHLLLGICSEQTGQAAIFLHQRGITADQVRTFLQQGGAR